MKDFVEDKFFSKGHYLSKFYQALVSGLMWILVFLPVIVTFKLIYTGAENNVVTPEWFQLEIIKIFNKIYQLVFLSMNFCLGAGLLLTMRNNFRIKHLFKKKVMYNAEAMNKKLILVEEFYTKQFSSKEIRVNKQFYLIQPSQNIESDKLL